MQAHIDEAVTRGWTTIAGLYGVEKRGGKLRPARCELPQGYGTIKGKSWKADPPVVKGRPISPHTKHCLKRISNAVARAHHTVLVNINTERVTRMFDTQEYRLRLASDQARVTAELRRLTGDPTAIPGFVHGMADVKDMYTAMSIEKMDEA